MLIPAGYREPVLTPRAARNVEALWTFAATQQGCTVVLPDGRCDIILRFQASGPALPIPIITGPATRPYTVHFTRGESWIGLRLRPGLGAALWKDALNGRLNDVRRGADALAVIPDLNVALRNSGSSQEIEQALLSLPCIQNARPCAAMLQTALDTIHVSGGRMSISDLARICGCTTRHLGRLFHVGLGLSPKTYAQLVRFHRAVALLAAGVMPLSQVAFETGYADHAHMCSELRLFGGFSPSTMPADLSQPGFFG